MEDDYEYTLDEIYDDLAELERLDQHDARRALSDPDHYDWFPGLPSAFVDQALMYAATPLARSARFESVIVPGRMSLDEVVALENRRTLKGDLTTSQWLELLDAYERKCAYCFQANRRLQMEHIHPVSAGGCTTIVNILPACHTCNHEKKAKSLKAWLGPATATAVLSKHEKIVESIQAKAKRRPHSDATCA